MPPLMPPPPDPPLQEGQVLLDISPELDRELGVLGSRLATELCHPRAH